MDVQGTCPKEADSKRTTIDPGRACATHRGSAVAASAVSTQNACVVGDRPAILDVQDAIAAIADKMVAIANDSGGGIYLVVPPELSHIIPEELSS